MPVCADTRVHALEMVDLNPKPRFLSLQESQRVRGETMWPALGVWQAPPSLLRVTSHRLDPSLVINQVYEHGQAASSLHLIFLISTVSSKESGPKAL